LINYKENIKEKREENEEGRRFFDSDKEASF